jgi:ssDNA-binding Zn-finger/Zn-ribbon topoisomerase 1
MTITISGTCPSCGHALKVCQAKSGAFYVGCGDYPRCDFRCPYDPILQGLRDRNARLQAELTLFSMQRTSPNPKEQTQGMRTGAKGVQKQRRAMYTWADVAAKWGATLHQRSEGGQA